MIGTNQVYSYSFKPTKLFQEHDSGIGQYRSLWELDKIEVNGIWAIRELDIFLGI